MSGLPRATIDEVITRWEVARLPLILVEGSYDKKIIELTQTEDFCPAQIRDIDVWTADAVDADIGMLLRHGIETSGAKQRVIGFIREMESLDRQNGICGVIDRDIDQFIPVSHSSDALLYTDEGAMELFFWNESIFRIVLVQFNCQDFALRKDALKKLYDSITEACRILAFIRASSYHGCNFSMHDSEKSLSMVNDQVFLDWEKYLMQCRIKADLSASVINRVDAYINEHGANRERTYLNGHDLMWLITFAIKSCTKGPVRQAEQSLVESSFLAVGVSKCSLEGSQLLQGLKAWRA